jgi:plasmid stabilization system protein ParE
MKVVYTAGARSDLDEIGEWLSDHYPTIAPAVERRIHNVIARIAQWPQSAPFCKIPWRPRGSDRAIPV